ncbi:MAG: pilus assembly protein PilP [Syntrophales bacterium]|nr:pilus assembly protein PilP [Syntrophales bacterium]
MIFLLVGGTGEKGTPCGKMSPLQAAEGDTLRQGVPTLPPAAPAGGSGGPGATPVPAAAPPADPAYQYNAAGKADPFMPFLEMDLTLKKKKEEGQKKKAAAMGRPISPLQQAELGQFRLLGIAGDENRRAAIVAHGPTKKFYPLFVGTYIGLNEGRVAAILPDRLVVEERVETQDKKKRKRVQVRQIPVLLHKEQ